MNEPTPLGIRLALAAIAGCAGSATIYAVVRIVQALRGPEADPALIIWSPHAGFFWRSWTSFYVGGMLAFIAYVTAGRHPERTGKVLAAAVTVAALLIGAQGLLVP